MSTFNIKADFTNGVKIEGGFITFVQQDTQTCELALELLDKGNLIDMTNRRATFSVVTPSGATIEETHLEVVDATLGKLKLVMPSDMILEAGKHKAQIQLYPLESYARESTLIFNYSVTPSLMSDQKLLATERFGTLEGLIVTVEGLQNDVNGNVETIEKAQVAAEKAKDDALLSASYSIQSATSAKEAAQAATTMTGVLDEVVEQARQSALASTESAQAAKASADEADRAAKTALAATDKANTAVSTANKALADVNTAIVDITEAKQVIDNAAITANNAANEATNAVTQTNQLAQTVHTLSDKVNTANQTANSNLQAIDIIANKADSAAGKAEASLTKADEVSKKVDAALVVAEGVVAQANTANLTANKAVVDATNQANIAKGEVTKATEQANKSKTEADRAATQATTALGHANKAKEEADKAGLAGEQAFKDGIHLNGESQSIFDFKKNEVVQDGLINAGYINTDKNTDVGFKFTDEKQFNVGTRIITRTDGTKFSNYLFGQGSNVDGVYVTVTDIGILALNLGNGTTVSSYKADNKLNMSGLVYDIVLWANNNRYQIFVNGELYISVAYTDIKFGTYGNFAINGFRSQAGTSQCTTLFYYAYTKSLTPQEINHTINVLNNSPSLSALATTDSTGKQSKLTFSSDTDHVEDRTGRTQEEINRTFYKRNCKEFVADASGEIKVDNGEEGYVLSASMEGQTVKCVSRVYEKFLINGNGNSRTIYLDCKQGVGYTFIINVTKNTRTQNSFFATTLDFNLCDIPVGKTGTLVYYRTAQADVTNTKIGVRSGDGELEIDGYIVLEGDYTNKNQVASSYMPSGLNSTEASITANGIKHTFYEPVIKGLTKIVDANGNECAAGTTGARLVNLEPSVEGLPTLGEWDYIDIANREIVLNAEYEITGEENWGTANTNENSSIFFCIGIVSNMEKSFAPICTHFTGRVGTVLGERFIGTNSSQGYLYVGGLKSEFPTVEALKSYFKQQKLNGTPVVVRLKTSPITQQLTPDQVKAYDAHKKPILLSKVGDVADKFEIKEDGSCACINNITEVILDGGENYTLTGTQLNNTVSVMSSFAKPMNANTGTNRLVSNKIPQIDLSAYGTFDGLCIGSINSLASYFIRVPKTLLVSEDITGVKAWLAQNPVTVKYQLATPTTTYIPKSIMPTIPTDKINNLSAGGAVKASKFTASLPVDKMADVEKRLQALESVTIALS